MYYCPVCGKEYAFLPNLKVHFEKRHSDLFKDGMCPVCGEKFQNSWLWCSAGLLKHLMRRASQGDPHHAILYALLTRGRWKQLKDVGASLLSNPKYYKCLALVRRREER